MAEATTTENPNERREGARWINRRPDAEEFAAWFKENVKIDDALSHDKYVGGCVLIPATEKIKVVTGYNQDGGAMIVEREQLVFVPYSKVETRIDYLWDYVEAHELVAVIEPTETRRPEAMVSVEETTDEGGIVTRRETTKLSAVGQIVEQLPKGFFIMSVPVGENYSHFLCCSYRVGVYRTDEEGNAKGVALREGRGTKMVALTRSSRHNPPRVWADENSIMKAETGAKGRALGFAGILVIPGSGVATAEDMIEATTSPDAAAQPAPEGGQGPASPETPQTGAEAAQGEAEQLLARARELAKELNEGYPDAWATFGTWAKSLRPPITDFTTLTTTRLRGVVRRMEKIQDEAKQRAAERGEPSGEEPQDGPDQKDVDAPDAKPGAEGEAPAAAPADETPAGDAEPRDPGVADGEPG